MTEDTPLVHFDVAEPPEDWRQVTVADDDDDDEILEQTPPHVVSMLGFDPLEADLDDGYNPDQPRDPKGSPTGGRWTSSPSGGSGGGMDRSPTREGSPELKSFLSMMSQAYQQGAEPRTNLNKPQFILDFGKSYKIDEGTYKGRRGTAKQCYMNAGRAAIGNPDLTYVEGYISMMGVPIEHAWNVDKQGRLIDPTLKDGHGVREYFGVPFTTDYLIKATTKNGYWGLLGDMSLKTLIPLLSGEERNFLADYDPDQPRDPKGSPTGGQWTKKGSGSTVKMNPESDDRGDFIFGDYMPPELERRMHVAIEIAKAMPETYHIDTEERRAMRQAIVEKLYNKDVDKRARNREATIILGLPGAGKSTLANPLIKEGALEVDPDLAKVEIPEFAGGIGANAVHEESSAITREIRNRAIANGDNIVWPRIDGKDKLIRDIASLHAAGYKVKVQIIDVSQETAIKSAIDRFIHTGRLVSPSTILEYGNTPEETYQAAKLIPGVVVERYKREHGKGVERVGD